MKLREWLFGAALVSLSCGVPAQKPETPGNFTGTGELTTMTSSPFYRIDLPEYIHQQSAWPDLRDLRVFNRRGDTMAFALVKTTVQQNPLPQVPLRFFRLRSQVNEQGERVFSVRQENGPSVTLVDRKQQMLSNWLIEVLEPSVHGLSRLKLSWQQLPENWQARVDVSGSYDLDDWRTIKRNMPLMDLASQSGRLVLDTIALGEAGQRPYRYLLLTFDKGSAPSDLNLNAVEGTVGSRQPPIQRISVRPAVKVISGSEVMYSWAQPQPLELLTIQPGTPDSVLPLEVEYRNSKNGVWRPLTRQVFYSVQGTSSEPVWINGEVIQAVRVKSTGISLQDSPPKVTGERDEVSLVFNAQGGEPYILAWGNHTADSQVLSLDALIPPALREGRELHQLPLAKVGNVFEAGGAQRLADEEQITTPPVRAGLWGKGVLWGLLIVGVVGLLLLAARVWRELRNAD